jgi:hypothetical protein
VLRHWQRETRLSTVEGAVLDVHRVGDLDGSQVPAAWFDFLRTGRVATLARVLSHNLQDLRSTAALLGWLGASWSEQVAVTSEVSLGLGEVAERAHFPQKAERFFERATSSAMVDVQARALIAMGRMLRRRGALDQAAATWERAVPLCEDASTLHLALARLYEHRLRAATSRAGSRRGHPASRMASDSARSGVVRASCSVPARSPKRAAASARLTTLCLDVMTARLRARRGSARCATRRRVRVARGCRATSEANDATGQPVPAASRCSGLR